MDYTAQVVADESVRNAADALCQRLHHSVRGRCWAHCVAPDSRQRNDSMVGGGSQLRQQYTLLYDWWAAVL